MSLHHQIAAAEAAAYNAPGPRAGQIVLPGGIVVDADQFTGLDALGVADATRILGEPERLLLDPKPGHKYVWAARNGTLGAQTTNKFRSQLYRPVRKEEINLKAHGDFTFGTHMGTTEYCMWRDLILCELSPRAAAVQYDAPVAQYVRTLQAQQETFKGDVERHSDGRAIAATATESKSE